MVFTDNPVLMDLGAQINRLLIERQKINANFKREQISSRKMLANISHDIKTPLTVILGYLEIMRLNQTDDEMLEKVEEKARQVMNLINQFFTLAKLESGDTDVKLCKINISEVCRENILGFYDILLQKEFKVDLDIPDTPVFVQGDKDALQRIFILMWLIKGKESNESLYLMFLTGYIQWKTPEIGKYKAMVWV